MKKIITVIGPESTGKSTLSQRLAEAFGCAFVPEYAREYLEARDGLYQYEDLLAIARGQWNALHQAMDGWDMVVQDTNLEVVKVWSEHYFGTCHEWILQQLALPLHQYYILTDIDMPWVYDPLREHPEPHMRQYFFEIYKDIVCQSGYPFTIVRGDEEARFQQSITALRSFIAQGKHIDE